MTGAGKDSYSSEREGWGMSKWIPCGEHFIVGDVIRWREIVWKEKRSPGSKSVKIGESLMMAEVLQSGPDGWVELELKSRTRQHGGGSFLN